MQVQIEMESRRCVNCGNPFRVMTTSPVKTCSTICSAYGMPGPGAPARKSNADGLKTGPATITVTKPKKPSEKLNQFAARVGNFPPPRKNINSVTTTGTAKKKTPGEQIMQNATEKNSAPTTANGTRAIAPVPLKRSTPAATPVTQPVLSEESRANLQRAGLDSMTLLQRSGNKLLQLIEECVPESHLDRSKEGGAPVETHRIQTALDAANALANTVQAQINMVKALTAVIGE